MSIQELSVSHNQKKKLLKAIQDDNVLFQEENGDIVVNVAAYKNLKEESEKTPIEEIVGDKILDLSSQYIVLS